MAKRDDFVWNNIYTPHLRGGNPENNPVKNEKVLAERMYVRVFTELACNRFKWTNLPKTIDVRFLELTLFRKGLSIFFFDEYNKETKKGGTDRFFALEGSGAGPVNMYDNPTRFQVTGNGQMNRVLSGKECVPIWSNYLRVPDWDIVLLYASRLAQIDQTISIASMNMRNTNVVISDENTRLSMTNFMRQRDEGQPIIFATNGFNPQNIAAIDLKQHPDTLPKLMIAKSKLWNECMTLLGINNANQDKRERLVSDEVSANDEQIDAVRQIALNARQEACDRINEMYGEKLDGEISVEFHVTAQADSGMMGGLENGNNDNVPVSSDGTN